MHIGKSCESINYQQRHKKQEKIYHMQMTVEISAKVYEELRKSPLFFVKFYENIRMDENGREFDYS